MMSLNNIFKMNNKLIINSFYGKPSKVNYTKFLDAYLEIAELRLSKEARGLL